MNVVIIANGEMQDRARLREIWRAADLRVAANGGAVNARQYLALAPHVLIGDLDSLDDATRAWCMQARVETIQHPRTKDETDLELALDLAITRGATKITLLGALGGRFDQMLANVLLLVKPASAHVAARIAGADFDAWLAWERAMIRGKIGETVSLIPLTERVEGIVTRGLRYALQNETLSIGATRGVSNELIAERAEVAFTRGLLVVVHLTAELNRATLSPQN
ncbi:MAG: thiamine diphosphokinase [Anaerolineales bacterium]|nr:thiamine diphosphokinase [Anaerolineales bacterium]